MANGIPEVSISNFAGWDSPSSTLYSPTTEIEGGDTVSIVKGQHSIRTGVLIIRNRKDQNGRSLYDGNIAFATSNPDDHGLCARRRAARQFRYLYGSGLRSHGILPLYRAGGIRG